MPLKETKLRISGILTGFSMQKQQSNQGLGFFFTFFQELAPNLRIIDCICLEEGTLTSPKRQALIQF